MPFSLGQIFFSPTDNMGYPLQSQSIIVCVCVYGQSFENACVHVTMHVRVCVCVCVCFTVLYEYLLIFVVVAIVVVCLYIPLICMWVFAHRMFFSD